MGPMGLLATLFHLPPFLTGIFMMYWSVPLAILMNLIQIWKFKGPRNDAFGWGVALKKMFGIRVLKLPGPQLYKNGNVVYLSNHRSWTDFFLDVVVTDGHAMMLSRWAVFWVFPMFMSAVMFIRSVFLFKRDAVRDKEAFNKKIDRALERSPVSGIIVYPEGHRSTRPESLVLKRGMLHYAHSRNHIVQIVMSANKEAVINEKHLRVRFGQQVLTGYADPIQPSDYPVFDDFVAEIQSRWDALWKRVYAASYSEGHPMEPEDLNNKLYPMLIKVQMVFVGSINLLAFFATLYYLARAAAAFFALFGAHRPAAVAVAAVWIAASFWAAYRPVQLPKLRPAAAAATANGEASRQTPAVSTATESESATAAASQPSRLAANGLAASQPPPRVVPTVNGGHAVPNGLPVGVGG